jgi:hypothetical protein
MFVGRRERHPNASSPSTGPSTLCAGIDDFRQLQTMLGTWSLVGPGARLAFLGLLVRMLKKLPVSPAQSETQPVSAQPLPTAPPPSPETGREDVQSIVVRRDRPSEITSSSPSSEIVLRDEDGDDEDAEEEEESQDDDEESPTNSQIERSAASTARKERLQEQLRQEEMTAKQLEERIANVRKANAERNKIFAKAQNASCPDDGISISEFGTKPLFKGFSTIT